MFSFDVMDNISTCEWQIVQLREGLRVLLRGKQETQQEEALRQALQQALASQGVSVPPIWIERVAVIPRNESGKMTPIVPAL